MDTAIITAGFVRPRGRETQVLRDPTHAESTNAFRGGWFRLEMQAIRSDRTHRIRGCNAFSGAEGAFEAQYTHQCVKVRKYAGVVGPKRASE
jgi:hypothetical protein